MLEASVEVKEDGTEYQPLGPSLYHRSYDILQKEIQIMSTNMKVAF